MPLDPGTLAEFKVLIDAQTNKLQNELRKVKGQMRREGRESAQAWSSAFTKGLGVTFTAAAAATALRSFVKDTFSSIDALGKQSDRLGLSIENLQRYRFAADKAGTSNAEFGNNMERFVKRIGEAAQGTGEARTALAILGIQLRKDDGTLKSTDQTFREVADGLSRVKTEAERAALAADLFGRDGSRMTNLFENGAEGIDKSADALSKHGLVTRQEAKNIEEVNDKWNDYMTNIENFSKRIFVGTVGLFSDAHDAMMLEKKLQDQINALDRSRQRPKSVQQGFSALAAFAGATGLATQTPGYTTGGGFGGTTTKASAAKNYYSPAAVPAGAFASGRDPWMAALPPRMAELDLSTKQNTEALKAATSATEKLREAWSGVELPTSVTGRFISNPVAVGIDSDSVLYGDGPRVGSVRQSGGRPGVVQNFIGGNFQSPDEALRRYNAQIALQPRGF